MNVSTVTKLFGTLAAYVVIVLLLMGFAVENGVSSTGFFAVLVASFAVFAAFFYGICRASKTKRLMYRLD